MAIIHNLGFPRIGPQRELKFLLENYWRGDIGRNELLGRSQAIRNQNWQLQSEAGLDLVPVNDFSLYDHVLDMSLLLGVIPERFRSDVPADGDPDLYFRMARGQSGSGERVAACEMTKWFDTNYHYIVPEFQSGQTFQLSLSKLLDEVDAALAAGHRIKPVLIGPLTYLWLGKCRDEQFNKLDLLEPLLEVYGEILDKLSSRVAIEWIQIDEPVLTLDLPEDWQRAFITAYQKINQSRLKLLLTTYFGGLGDNLAIVLQLPVQGLHADIVRAPAQIDQLLKVWPKDKVLSLGLIDGRNIWRSDLENLFNMIDPLRKMYGDNLWLAPSCSLLHCPVDLEQETKLDRELISWLAFAVQKLRELNILTVGVEQGKSAVIAELRKLMAAGTTRKNSVRIHNPVVQQRLQSINADMTVRENPFSIREEKQREVLNLPLLPTTTIGSFPQTATIRKLRRDFRQGLINEIQYEDALKQEIKLAIKKQEQLGLDVLVHGEAERNDMVEYFAHQLEGFAFTEHGWVQSYGSRCVKPPIIYGDVSRPAPMTVSWIQYAQSLTNKPVKGMLTGPVTILQWSFVRDDQPRSQTCKQIALALRDEIRDLEAAGIAIIQVDEPALREGLPLRKIEQAVYLKWAIEAFRLATAAVKDTTQIHTHMCYAEFNDILDAIAGLDADVISIEASRSGMELLDAFQDFKYPNQIGPGVYDIHSPNLVSAESMQTLLEKACRVIPAKRLWVNPDCGLKTRDWREVEVCLANMVTAAHRLRDRHLSGAAHAA